MKRIVIVLLIVTVTAWAIVLGAAIHAACSADIIGGADFPTFQFKLMECLHTPFGIFVQVFTIGTAAILIVFAIGKLFQVTKRKNK